ncbi:MAG: dTDP-4-dehydrorhamnose 3,5-epimerase family protein [Polaromonas sp.]|nr:dTDP-4-dehydrorhamnose 3,5-epimerase family protein [Polaromonas sp.]
MSRFTLHNTPLAGLVVVQRQIIGDHRGFLSRLFCADELSAAGWRKPVAQINHTLTEKAGTIRGMHFQHPPHQEMKLVTCIRGAVWDVAVDLRAGSPTFLQWHGQELSAANQQALLIPEGFAHGFQSLVDGCELVYLHSAAYVPTADAGLHTQDTRLGITWPLPVSDMSDRDGRHPRLDDSFKGLTL